MNYQFEYKNGITTNVESENLVSVIKEAKKVLTTAHSIDGKANIISIWKNDRLLILVQINPDGSILTYG